MYLNICLFVFHKRLWKMHPIPKNWPYWRSELISFHLCTWRWKKTKNKNKKGFEKCTVLTSDMNFHLFIFLTSVIVFQDAFVSTTVPHRQVEHVHCCVFLLIQARVGFMLSWMWHSSIKPIHKFVTYFVSLSLKIEKPDCLIWQSWAVDADSSTNFSRDFFDFISSASGFCKCKQKKLAVEKTDASITDKSELG